MQRSRRFDLEDRRRTNVRQQRAADRGLGPGQHRLARVPAVAGDALRDRRRRAAAAEVPAYLVGAGSGLMNESGCIQIQTDHEQALAEHGLDELRLGDVVAVRDYDSRWGNGYLKDAVCVGVVVHGDSPRAGYGPGLTVIMASTANRIRPVVRGERNVAELLGLATSIGAAA